MKRVLLCLPLLLAACSQEENAGNQPRIVDQDALQSPYVPIEATDQAVQTEAIRVMGLIARQVHLKASTSSDKAALYRSISGTPDAGKLAKLGMTEAELKTSYYVASDYAIAIVGNEMTISAAKPGTRGRVEPQKFRVP
jgi:hypothetical protein